MSEDQTGPDAPMAAPAPLPDHLDAEATKLLEFFNNVGASMECPCCKKTSWDLEVGPDADHKASLRFEARADDGAIDKNAKVSFIPVYALTCINCGFLRLHRRAAISNWQSNRRKEKA